MAEENTLNGLQGFGGFSLLIAIVLFITGEVGNGVFCCLFGIFGIVGGTAMTAASNAKNVAGKMQLRQGPDGEWRWDAVQGETAINQGGQPSSFAYNNQENQTLSRIISQVRGGKNLQELDSNELSTLANAYGVQGHNDEQRIQGLTSSPMASKALKIGMVAAGGVAALGGASIVAKARKEAKEKALAARETAKEKVKQETKSVSSMLPESEIEKIRNSGITPSEIMKFADFNKDGRIDAVELSGAMTAALGMSIPVIFIQSIIREFDSDGSDSLSEDELNQLWSHLGLETEKEIEEIEEEVVEEGEKEESIEIQCPHCAEDIEVGDGVYGLFDCPHCNEEFALEKPEEEIDEINEEEIEEVFEEIDEVIEEEVTEVEDVVEEEVEEELEQEMDEIQLTEGIDTELEEAILQLEQARLTSERRTILEGDATSHILTLKITKIERTLLGETGYRGGQSLHGLIDGGPYSGLVQLHTDLDDKVLELKEGDEIKLLAQLIDYKPSLKRPVLKTDSIQG